MFDSMGCERHDFVNACCWPSYTGGKSVHAKTLFRKAGDFKCGFSSRRMLLAAQCFYRLCKTLDLLSHAASGTLRSNDLREAILGHLRSFKTVYGAEHLPPNGHFNVHLPEILDRHGVLLSCFVHERRHKELKRYANQQTSMTAGSEKNVMELSVEHHLEVLEDFDARREGLLKPRPAAQEVARVFCAAFGRARAPGLEISDTAYFGSGRTCKRGDIIVVEMENASHVGQAWFHVSQAGYLYTCFSPWTRQRDARNRFSHEDGALFVPTSSIKRLCIHRPENDNPNISLVIPLRSMF